MVGRRGLARPLQLWQQSRDFKALRAQICHKIARRRINTYTVSKDCAFARKWVGPQPFQATPDFEFSEGNVDPTVAERRGRTCADARSTWRWASRIASTHHLQADRSVAAPSGGPAFAASIPASARAGGERGSDEEGIVFFNGRRPQPFRLTRKAIDVANALVEIVAHTSDCYRV